MTSVVTKLAESYPNSVKSLVNVSSSELRRNPRNVMAPHRTRNQMASNVKLITNGLENTHIESGLKTYGYQVHELIIEIVFMVRHPIKRVSRVQRIQFSIQGDNWYENLCKNLKVDSVNVLTADNGFVPIKNLTRDQIVVNGRIFGDMGSRIYTGDIEIPKYHVPNYTHDVDTVLRQILKDSFTSLTNAMKVIQTPSEFAKYLRNDMLFDFIACLDMQMFSNATYEVRGVIDFKHFAETYLRTLCGKKARANFVAYLVARVFKPLWIVLHHLNSRFQNYVYEIHAKNNQNGNGSLKMNTGHFGAFWKMVFAQYHSIYFARYSDSDEVVSFVRRSTQIIQNNVPDDKLFLVGAIDGIANRYTRFQKSSVKDPYLQMYSEVASISYVEYELTGNTPHPEAVYQNIVEGVPLMKHYIATVNNVPEQTLSLIAAAMKSFEKIPAHSITILLSHSSEAMVFPVDSDSTNNLKVEYDSTSALMVYKLINPITGARVIINPITGEWQLFDQKAGKFISQNGILIEVRHKTVRYLTEYVSEKTLSIEHVK